MNELLRRVALCVALPLVVGAPAVLVAGPAYAAASTTVLVLNDSTPVYGQPLAGTVTVMSGAQLVNEGFVVFTVADPSSTEVSFAPVPVVNGHAVSPVLTDPDGGPFHVVTGLDFYSVTADFVGSDNFDPSSDSEAPIQPTEAGSTTAILAAPHAIVADVTGALPGGIQQGSLKPTGSVAFKVDGADVGNANLVNGQATISYTIPNGAPHTVLTTYAGDTDDNYTGSQESLTRADPTISARVVSKFPPSRSGWYHTAVDIWFKCDPAGYELVIDCPEIATLRKSGRNQSLARSILATDGGAASVTVTGIDIDRKAPEITVLNRFICKATDKLSGVKHSRCKMRPLGGGRYLAIAVDRAGNRATLGVNLD